MSRTIIAIIMEVCNRSYVVFNNHHWTLVDYLEYYLQVAYLRRFIGAKWLCVEKLEVHFCGKKRLYFSCVGVGLIEESFS